MLARVATSIVGIPLILYCVTVTSYWPFKVLVGVLWLLFFLEFNRAERIEKKTGAWILPLLVIVMIVLWPPSPENGWQSFVTTSSYFLVLGALIAIVSIAFRHFPARAILLQICWLTLPVPFLLALWSLENPATTSSLVDLNFNRLIIVFFLCLWAGDIFGLFVGKLFGKHKLAPSLSPGKTWEGAIGNLVTTASVGTASIALIDGIPWQGTFFGVVISMAGQCGDLFQSGWKRRHSMKDSGALLPGHGGVLDRFDSLLFAIVPATVVAYLLW